MTLGQNQIYDASPFSIDMSTGFTGIFSLNHGNTNSWAYFLNFRDSNTNNRIILQRTTSWNGWNFYIQNAGGGDVCNVQTSQNFIKNAWYHVILRKSANSLNLDVMYNGDTFSYSVACTTTFENSMDLAHVGALSNGASFSLNAFLFIDQHLTDSEVETIVQKMDTLHIPGYPPQDTTSSNLEICPANTYNDGSFTTCQTCPTGTYTSKTGSSAVTDCLCQPGYFTNSSSLCEACAVGTFKSTVEDATCSACPAGMTTTSTASTACVCMGGFEPNADYTACQACPAGEAKFVTGNGSCISCTDHATLQSDLPHQESSCRCDPGYTGTHLECSPCGEGFFKSSYGTDACTACTEYATTAGPTSTDISACVCVAPYYPGPVGGPDEPSGTCVWSCSVGMYEEGGVCASCPEGFFKPDVGPQACTPCASPRNASRAGSTSADACSCRAGEIALGGGRATLLGVTGLDLSETSAYACTDNPCVYTTGNTGNFLPLHRVVLAAAALQAAPITSLTVTVARAGVPIVFFSCATQELCAGVSEVDLRGARADTVTVDVVGDGSYAPIITRYLRATAAFADTETVSTWDQAAAERVVLAQDVQVGESVFDTATAVLQDAFCVQCAARMLCGPYV